MPSGGKRVGAGRKPRSSLRAVATRRVPSEEKPKVADDALRRVPAGLADDQAAIWETYAGPAIEAGTLTSRMVGAFAFMVKLIAQEQAILVQIEADGWTFTKVTIDGAGQEQRELKAHPLCPHYRGIVQRVDAQMKSFAVAPFGKPVDPTQSAQAPVNPWARVVTP